MKIVEQISYWIDRCCRFVLLLLIITVSISLFVQVFARFVLNTGSPWTDELARFAMVWLTFIGAAVSLRDGSHINITLLEEKVPQLNWLLAWIQKIIILVYLFFVGKIGWDTIALVANQKSPNMGVSMSVLYLVLPVAAVLMGVQLINRFFNKHEQGGEA